MVITINLQTMICKLTILKKTLRIITATFCNLFCYYLSSMWWNDWMERRHTIQHSEEDYAETTQTFSIYNVPREFISGSGIHYFLRRKRMFAICRCGRTTLSQV